MIGLRRRAARGFLAAAAALLLAGGGMFTSQTPLVATPGASAPGRLPAAGVYCPLETLETISRHTCYLFERVEGDVLVAQMRDGSLAGQPRVRFVIVSSLNRGATLIRVEALDAQSPAASTLYLIAILREDGLAFSLGPYLSENDIADAARIGVRVAPRYDGAFHLEGGRSEEIIGWLANVVGLQFDRALREPGLFAALTEPGNLYIRISGAPGPTGAEIPTTLTADQRAAMEALLLAIRFAITLE